MKKIIFSFLVFSSILLMYYCGSKSSSSSSSSGAAVSTTTTDSSSTTIYAAKLQSSGRFGAMMLDSTGNMLLPLVDRDSNGKAQKVSGVLYTKTSSGYILVKFDEAGLPKQTVIGDFVLLFSNWDTTKKTVDIAKIYAPTKYIELFTAVSYTSPALAAASLKLEGGTCFPTCDTDNKNLAELLKIAGVGMSLGGCAFATTVSLGVAALPCAGLLVNTAILVKGDEAWLGDLGRIVGSTDVFKCALAEVESCISAALDMNARALDVSEKVYGDSGGIISSASVFETNPDRKAGVVQQGDGLPICTNSYQCSPNAYMPCYPSGVKQCSLDCTWSACPSSSDSSSSSSGSSGGTASGSSVGTSTGTSSGGADCTCTCGWGGGTCKSHSDCPDDTSIPEAPVPGVCGCPIGCSH